MSRIKHLVCLLALFVFCLPAQADSNLLEQALRKSDSGNYDTQPVTLGEYVKTGSGSGSEYYPHTQYVSYHGASAQFKQYLVTRGDEVKAGDPVAEVTVVASPTELESAQLELTRAEEAYAQGLIEWQEQLDELSDRLSAAADRFEREEIRIALDRARLALEQYTLRQEYDIAERQADVAEMTETRENYVVRAPGDGVITDINFTREGAALYDGYYFMTLYTNEDMLIYVDNANGFLRFNMPVTVEVGASKTRVALTGRVVVADDMLAGVDQTGMALVRLDPYDEEEIKLRNIIVTGNTIELDNVLTVPRSTLTLTGGKYLVTKLEDGAARTRYVNFAANNTTTAWILQGLREGDQLIID